MESFRTYLLGPVLSFALLRQGIEPLHGTVVVQNNIAVILLGNSGYGKSSLAAAFLRAGCRLLTDDLVVIQEKTNDFVAFPGSPRIKLLPEVARRILGSSAQAKRMHRNFGKLVIPLKPEQTCRSPKPVRAIYVLTEPAKTSKSGGIVIRRLSGSRAFAAVIKNTFNTKVTDGARLQRQFEAASRVVAGIPVKTLNYPRGLDLLPAVCHAVLADIARMDANGIG